MKTTEKKYLVLPGYVTSKNDGALHFITAHQIMDLYGVNPSECWIQEFGQPPIRGVDTSALIALRPSYEGDYRLPKPRKA